MSLHSGIDTVAIAAGGSYTETYGSSSSGAIANLYASRGYFEDAPNLTTKIAIMFMHFFRMRT